MQKERADHSGNHRGNTIESKTIENIIIYMSQVWFEWT
jgi:hypothetical protein